MNKFIEILKKQKAEKMGKVVNKIEPTEQDVINAAKKQVEDLCKEEVETSTETNAESLYKEDETINVDNRDVIEKPKKKRWGKFF